MYVRPWVLFFNLCLPILTLITLKLFDRCPFSKIITTHFLMLTMYKNYAKQLASIVLFIPHNNLGDINYSIPIL